MPGSSNCAGATTPRHRSVTPKPGLNAGLKTAHDSVAEDEAENDTSDDSFSDRNIVKLGSQDPDEPEGFLTAKNPSDAYFLAHGKPNPTSANLLSNTPNWKLPLPVSDYLGSFDPQPLESAKSNWEQWTAELVEGYSLLFHGLGSKRATLNEFVQQLVETLGWEGLVVNGFQTGADLSSILCDLEDIIISAGIEQDEEVKYPAQKKLSSLEIMESRARQLCRLLDRSTSNPPTCVLMIHNLDGLGLRNMRIQTILSLLAAQPSIHLIATIDHIYGPILLPSHLASAPPYVNDSAHLLQTFPSNYNFLYHHLPTNTPYTLESLLSGTISTLLPPNIFPPTMVGSQNSKSDISQNGATTAKATLHVLSSLTEKAKSLFRILAEHQISRHQSLPPAEAAQIDASITNLSEDGRAPRIAIPERKLFELARSDFVASVQSQMEALLVEFRDHAIVLGSSGPLDELPPSDTHPDRLVEDDQEWLWIGLCQNDLEDVLSKLDDL